MVVRRYDHGDRRGGASMCLFELFLQLSCYHFLVTLQSLPSKLHNIYEQENYTLWSTAAALWRRRYLPQGADGAFSRFECSGLDLYGRGAERSKGAFRGPPETGNDLGTAR